MSQMTRLLLYSLLIYIPTICKLTEIHKFTKGNGAFHLVVCTSAWWRCQDYNSQRVRKDVGENMLVFHQQINFCLHFLIAPKSHITVAMSVC